MNWKRTLNEKSKYIITGTLLLLSLLGTVFKCKTVSDIESRKIPALIINTSTGIHPFILITATSEAERNKGLMFIANLKPDEGMIFIFPETGQHSFWMYNTFIPLDILFIDGSNKVVHIIKNTQPHSTIFLTSSNIDSKYAIELLGGTVDRLGINLSSRISFSLE